MMSIFFLDQKQDQIAAQLGQQTFPKEISALHCAVLQSSFSYKKDIQKDGHYVMCILPFCSQCSPDLLRTLVSVHTLIDSFSCISCIIKVDG